MSSTHEILAAAKQAADTGAVREAGGLPPNNNTDGADPLVTWANEDIDILIPTVFVDNEPADDPLATNGVAPAAAEAAAAPAAGGIPASDPVLQKLSQLTDMVGELRNQVGSSLSAEEQEFAGKLQLFDDVRAEMIRRHQVNKERTEARQLQEAQNKREQELDELAGRFSGLDEHGDEYVDVRDPLERPAVPPAPAPGPVRTTIGEMFDPDLAAEEDDLAARRLRGEGQPVIEHVDQPQAVKLAAKIRKIGPRRANK